MYTSILKKEEKYKTKTKHMERTIRSWITYTYILYKTTSVTKRSTVVQAITLTLSSTTKYTLKKIISWIPYTYIFNKTTKTSNQKTSQNTQKNAITSILQSHPTNGEFRLRSDGGRTPADTNPAGRSANRTDIKVIAGPANNKQERVTPAARALHGRRGHGHVMASSYSHEIQSSWTWVTEFHFDLENCTPTPS